MNEMSRRPRAYKLQMPKPQHMRALVKEPIHKLHASGAPAAMDSARTASEPWAKICSLENSVFGRVLKRSAHRNLSRASSTTEVCSGIARGTQPLQQRERRPGSEHSVCHAVKLRAAHGAAHAK